MMQTLHPPRRAFRLGEHYVKAMTRMPDGRIAVARDGAETVLVCDDWFLAERLGWDYWRSGEGVEPVELAERVEVL